MAFARVILWSAVLPFNAWHSSCQLAFSWNSSDRALLLAKLESKPQQDCHCWQSTPASDVHGNEVCLDLAETNRLFLSVLADWQQWGTQMSKAEKQRQKKLKAKSFADRQAQGKVKKNVSRWA